MVVFPGVRYGTLQLKIQNDDYLPDPSMDDYLQSGLQFGASDRPEERGLGVAPAKPYVWRLWKRRGPPQPLVSGLLAVNCPSDGMPVPVDLLADHPWAKIPAGKTADLKLSIMRSPEDKFMVRSPWDFWVEAPSGGVVETGESFMYLAPEAGYKPKIEAGGQRKWSVGKRLFLKTRDGKMYGSVLLTVSAIGSLGGPQQCNTARPGRSRFALSSIPPARGAWSRTRSGPTRATTNISKRKSRSDPDRPPGRNDRAEERGLRRPRDTS